MSKMIEKLTDELAAIKTGQAVLVQKLDDFMTTQKVNHEEQRAYCTAHNAWTGALQKKVDEHEALKNRAIGAARIIAWVGGSSTVIGGIITAGIKLFHYRGETP